MALASLTIANVAHAEGFGHDIGINESVQSETLFREQKVFRYAPTRRHSFLAVVFLGLVLPIIFLECSPKVALYIQHFSGLRA
jgi:hypothetical protein